MIEKIMKIFGITTRRSEIMKLIKEDRAITQRTNDVLDEFVCSIDGENGWFRTTDQCIEWNQKQEKLRNEGSTDHSWTHSVS